MCPHAWKKFFGKREQQNVRQINEKESKKKKNYLNINLTLIIAEKRIVENCEEKYDSTTVSIFFRDIKIHSIKITSIISSPASIHNTDRCLIIYLFVMHAGKPSSAFKCWRDFQWIETLENSTSTSDFPVPSFLPIIRVDWSKIFLRARPRAFMQSHKFAHVRNRSRRNDVRVHIPYVW